MKTIVDWEQQCYNTNTDTTITSFDSTAIAADLAEDTAANLAVSWTTGALAGASTIKTGVGNDTIDASAAVKAVTIEVAPELIH